MHHRLSIPTYGLSGLRKGDEHPAYAPVEYGTFTLPYLGINGVHTPNLVAIGLAICT